MHLLKDGFNKPIVNVTMFRKYIRKKLRNVPIMFIAECRIDKQANIKSYKWCEISLKLYAVFKVNKDLMKQGMYSRQGM